MDFFERAHVVKKPAVKTNKSDETVKKQLKHMLRGYKQNDNKAIKEAENIKVDTDDTIVVDDSDSVSGFSDLNITNSSNEAEETKDTSSNIENIVSNSSRSNSPINEEEIKDNSSIQSAESISEVEEDIESLPENMQEVLNTSITENSSNTCEVDKTDDIMANDSSDDIVSSPSGCKILKRIKEKKIAKEKKRKLKRIKTSHNEPTDCNKSIITHIQKYVQLNQDENIEHTDNIDAMNQDSASHTTSSFVVLPATEMSDQSLSEILGEYKHPIIKKTPCEKQNVISVTDDCELFPDESLVADIVTEDGVDTVVVESDDESAEQNSEISPIVADEPFPELPATEYVPPIVRASEDNAPPRPVATEEEPHVKVYCGKDTCIFVLKHPAKIYLHGKVRAKALGGTIEVFGYTLNYEFSDIYAPTFDFVQCFRTVECQNTYYGLFRKLTSSGVSLVDAEEIVTTIGDYDGVLSLSSLCNHKIDFIENNFTYMDLFKKPKKYSSIENDFDMASVLLGCTLYFEQPNRCFVENPNWEQIVSCGLENGSRAIICGGKNTGKSTFLRYYVNKLVANGPVLVIDLDPGQPELTVPGNFSATVVTKPFIGPNFSHLHTPDKMLHIGMINPMDSPSRYTSGVISLFEYCNSNPNYLNMPWVVNTMGMVNNLGLKFIALSILLAQPTLLVQMDSPNPRKRFEFDIQPSAVQSFLDTNKYDKIFKNAPHADKIDYNFIMSSPIEEDAKVEVAVATRDLRYLNFLAYFGELIEIHRAPGILEIAPYEVKFEDLNIATNVSIREEVVARVINGKIIALCQMTTTDKGRVFTLTDNAVVCLGHGIVRGVDFEKNLLYVLTPIPANILTQVNLLVYSDWVPDLKGSDNQLPNGTVVPYRTTSRQRNLMTTPHRRFNPVQLLKMSRRS